MRQHYRTNPCTPLKRSSKRKLEEDALLNKYKDQNNASHCKDHFNVGKEQNLGC